MSLSPTADARHRVTRRILIRVSAAAVFALAVSAAWAQAEIYPAKPVRWIVPFPPAGAMDTIARTLGEQLTRKLGQPFVIDNRPGAGGNIGADFVAKATPDGHTMVIVANGMAVNQFLYKKLAYDPVKDFAPVSLLAVVPNVLVTNAEKSPARTVKDVMAQARAAPGKLTYASAGNGTSIHLAGELFTSLAGINMVHIPYKGSGPAVADLLGGHVDYMFDSITSARPHIESGRLRAIAVTTSTRSSALPRVPTIAEAGLPDYELTPWFAVFMPARTPASLTVKMHDALVEAIRLPEVKQRFATIGAEPIGSTPAELAAHLQAEIRKWGTIIRERNIRAE